MRYHSHINTALQLLHAYNGKEPFSHYVKRYFVAHKKYGSTDRKQITHLCYCYFRLGGTAGKLPETERLLLGLYLCSTTPSALLEALKPSWNETVLLPLNKKYAPLLSFAFDAELSAGIDRNQFNEAHVVQPDLFLRLRPGKEALVMEQLTEADITYKRPDSHSLALPNNTRVEEVVKLDTDAVVQDYSSQQLEHFLRMVEAPGDEVFGIWDCCAASGGKSILAKDVFSSADITVSDKRINILANLRKRFAAAGIRNYRWLVQDLLKPLAAGFSPGYHLIIADVPCSGSGTWGRTPEQLCFFIEETLLEYNDLQQKIVSNIIPRLLPGGYLLYSTCSVFKSENEDMVDFITHKFPLQLIKMEVIPGYQHKADTMFAALLKHRVSV